MPDPRGGGGGALPDWMSGLGGTFGGGPSAQQIPPSLLQMAQAAMGTGDDPYGGRTLAQTVIGGLPYNMNAGANGRPMGGGPGGYGGGGGGFDANAWLDRPATNENVSEAIQRGGQYRPEVAQTLQSGGPEGGYFSIPGTQVGGIAEASIPWGYHSDPRDNPAPGLTGMSTNNWRLLPQQYQDPRWAMRAGHIIERSTAGNPWAYVRGAPGAANALNLGGGAHGYPLSYGYPFQRGYFFPGQQEPWLTEGDKGVT